MDIRSRRGTTMVEAAMIFPLVISAVATVIFITLNLYLSLSAQASLHLALRSQCGELTQTVAREEKVREFPWEQDLIGIRPILTMEQKMEYRINTIFQNRITKTEKGRSYFIDEAELIRFFTFEKEET